MVHNGIEYGDMQLICEAYFMLKQALGLSNDELYDVFDEWNRGELDSYLIEITRDIFSVKDPETGGYLVDKILDTAGAKGTGKWMSQLALDLGVPSTLVTEAVYARCLSALKDARVRASKVLKGPTAKFTGDRQKFIEQIRAGALRLEDLQLRPGLRAAAGGGHASTTGRSTSATSPCCGAAAASFGPRSSTASRRRSTPTRSWRTCCWRRTSPRPSNRPSPPGGTWCATAVESGIPAPAFATALAYYDGYRQARLAGQPAAGPARLLRRPHVSAHRQARRVPHRLAAAAQRTRSDRATLHVAAQHVHLTDATRTCPTTTCEELFGLSGQVAVVIGGTGVLGGALCRRAGPGRRHGGRGRQRRRARRRSASRRIAEARRPGDVPAGRRHAAASRSKSLLAAHARRSSGRVDMLVNCAGVNSASAYLDVTDDDWQRVLDVNLRGTHWGCQIFGAHMAAAGGGAILNIGSVTAHLPLSRVFAYSASKAAVVNLTQNVARELAPHGVRVNALCPGFFPGRAEPRRFSTPSAPPPSWPKRRWPASASREELVGAALLLLSRTAGSFITGAAYYVDGGFTAMRF